MDSTDPRMFQNHEERILSPISGSINAASTYRGLGSSMSGLRSRMSLRRRAGSSRFEDTDSSLDARALNRAPIVVLSGVKKRKSARSPLSSGTASPSITNETSSSSARGRRSGTFTRRAEAGTNNNITTTTLAPIEETATGTDTDSTIRETDLLILQNLFGGHTYLAAGDAAVDVEERAKNGEALRKAIMNGFEGVTS